jgi:hypothetical protein
MADRVGERHKGAGSRAARPATPRLVALVADDRMKRCAHASRAARPAMDAALTASRRAL